MNERTLSRAHLLIAALASAALDVDEMNPSTLPGPNDDAQAEYVQDALDAAVDEYVNARKMTPERYRTEIEKVSRAQRATVTPEHIRAALTTLHSLCALGDEADLIKKWVFHDAPKPPETVMADLGNSVAAIYREEDAPELSERQEWLLLYALGIFGEGAEVVRRIMTVIQAEGYLESEFHMEKTIKEIGDLHWYVDRLERLLGLSMSQVLQANVDKLRARYPEGFDAAEKKYDHADG